MTGTEPRYRLDSRIATGGMGVVWRATDTLLDREVAVKVLKPEYADDPAFRSRFEAEARHAAALHHHNVASVFDFGELEPADGSGTPRPYLVMELVPGEPLSTLLRTDEPMPPETAADLGAQAADALAGAHAIGIVHRDVKPANLMVTPRGQIKITDFGIARAADGAALTQTGQVIGTPAYLAPEQAEGRPATHASDIYSLGVVLYECLAGTRPFGGDTPVSTALAHLRDEPPPLPDRVPAHLREVVATALAKDPHQRFTSMTDFAAALRGGPIKVPATAAAEPDAPDATRILSPVTAPLTSSADQARPDRGRPAWLPWAGTALAVLLVVVLLAWLGRGDEPDLASSSTPEETASSPAAEEPARVRIVADDYIGLTADEAEELLVDEGLRVRRTTVANPGDRTAGTVGDVAPTGRLAPDTRVTLSVWGPVAESDDEVDDEVAPKPEKEPKGKGHKTKKGH